MKKVQIVGYLIIVAFYAAVFGLAATRSQVGGGEELVVEQPADSIINWRSVLNEEPVLNAERESLDTLSNRVNRYGSGSLLGLDNSKELPIDLLLRTDKYADFMHRFNGDSIAMEQFRGKLDFTSFGRVSEREGHILALVNCGDVLEDSTLRSFAKTMVSEDLFITEGIQSNVVAVATLAYTDATGKLFPVRITLQQGEVDHSPIWYIVDAESPYFTYGNKEKPYYINRVDRELGFMSLAKHTDRSVESVTGEEFQGDGRTAFFLLASKGFITYQYSDAVKYIGSVGPYAFLVERVENFDHRRSGLLITRIIKDGRLIFENRPY